MDRATTIERKLRSTKVRLLTVLCCSIILFFSECIYKKKKHLKLLGYYSFYNCCWFYNCVFSHTSCIYQLCSIINVRVLYSFFCGKLFYHSCSCVTSFRSPRNMLEIMQIYANNLFLGPRNMSIEDKHLEGSSRKGIYGILCVIMYTDMP